MHRTVFGLPQQQRSGVSKMQSVCEVTPQVTVLLSDKEEPGYHLEHK